MFSKQHYVPILKWKRAEIRALEALESKNKNDMTPLLELVMPKVSNIYKDKDRKVKKTSIEIFDEIVAKFKEQRMGEIPLEIQASWGNQPIFIDFSLLYEAQFTTRLKVESLNTIIPAGNALGLALIPVVNLNDEFSIQETAALLSKKYNSGLCVRIAISDLTDVKKLNTKLENLLSSVGVDMVNIDLIVDLKSINEGDSQYLGFVNLIQEIINVEGWRSLILASGAAPEDLSKCKIDEATFIPRLDWLSWIKHAYENKMVVRIPTFSDYTIRNPVYKETEQFYAPTTSIRYTLESDWMIMKGKKLDFKLYLANAKLLVESSGRFYGEGFSAGDKFIADKAKHYDAYIRSPKLKGTGGSEDWIFAGVNHHLVLTAHQLASLA